MKVAIIVGEAGICSDDGRALTYAWRIMVNEHGGRGFYTDAKRIWNAPESEAREWCKQNGYHVNIHECYTPKGMCK